MIKLEDIDLNKVKQELEAMGINPEEIAFKEAQDGAKYCFELDMARLKANKSNRSPEAIAEAEFKAKQRYDTRLALIEFQKNQNKGTVALTGPDYEKWKRFIHVVHDLCNVQKTMSQTELSRLIRRSKQTTHTWVRRAARMIKYNQIDVHFRKSTFPKDFEAVLKQE